MCKNKNWYKIAQRANTYVIKIADQINKFITILQRTQNPTLRSIAPTIINLANKMHIGIDEDAREYGLRIVDESGKIWDDFLSNIPNIKNLVEYSYFEPIYEMGLDLA